jgi:hypothetical protein
VTREDGGKERCLRNRLEARIFGHCLTARGRTGQLRHRGKRFALQFGLELAFANRLVLVLVRIKIQNGNSGE